VFFAATFSEELSKHARNISAISRADAHKFLDQSGWTDKDLSASDVFAKFTSEFNPDAIVHGSVSLRDGKYQFEFTAQDLTGKELFRFPYQEEANLLNMTWLYLPPSHNPSGRIYYFAGLDGVSLPKMIFAPNPSYSPKARQDRVSGVVVLSAIVTPEGRTDQLSVIRKLHPDLDANSVATLKTWRLIPCKNPEGTPIPVRVNFEVSFRLYYLSAAPCDFQAGVFPVFSAQSASLRHHFLFVFLRQKLRQRLPIVHPPPLRQMLQPAPSETPCDQT